MTKIATRAITALIDLASYAFMIAGIALTLIGVVAAYSAISSSIQTGNALISALLVFDLLPLVGGMMLYNFGWELGLDA